ncbi:rhomboid family intramembrane serine protease [Palleronia sp. LCG004]|uniref:rhomboid family intramembrane serine protease n=1 Tax=Palleronia sp. LCG004 TaxID=3079304 RepID=UPI002943DB07|nr:rhomboid family intramembrane serine protease [Palleronia sp. LCG004]WOI57562.1 rhomboid family intramembrane serine protease [Palleronia sp. LCG004]
MSDHNQNPFNALPPVVVVLAVAIAGIEIVFQAGARGFGGADAVGWRLEALNTFAFSPQLWDRMVDTGQYPPAALLRLVSYSFVHLGFGHMLFVLVFLLALGKMVAEAFSSVAMVAVLFVSAVAGALAYGTLIDPQVALVGGYPAVYGLIGAYTYILWTGLGAIGEQRLRAFTLIAFLMGIQLVFGLLFGGGLEWVADLAGFAAGFLLSFLVSPGGWQRVLSRMRQR